MYREIVKPKPVEPKKAIFYVISIILFIILFTALSNVLYNIYRLSFINYMVYLTIVYIAWDVFRRRVIEYRYSLIDTDLIFEKLVGGHRTVSLSVNLDDMLALSSMDSKHKGNIKADAVYKFAHVSCKNEIYCGIFKHDGKIYKVLFQPDELLLQLLQSAWEKRHSDK